MAANQGNVPAIWQANLAAHQAHLAALQAAQEAAQLQATLNADVRRRAFREATTDLCEGIISSACVADIIHDELKEFHLFPKLPIELRIKIWRHSIDTPRCIEVCNELGWIRSLCKVPPPSVIFACRESHEQVIQAYNLYKNATAERHADADTTRWVRLEYDIIHMNLVPTGQEPDLAELSRAFAKPGHTTPIRQHARLNSQVHLSTDKWLNRPFGFDKIKTLAICRDLLVHLPDDYESFVRHFFPNLLVLIVLIDNETDIDEDWSIHDLEYGRYEKAVPKKLRSPGNPHGITRLDFIKKCKGPFKEVKLNIDYRMDIEFEMRKRFEKEEDSYDFYIAPRIRVLGASVPEGVSVDECGRLPAKLAKGKNNKYDANPFGDSVNEDFSTIRS